MKYMKKMIIAVAVLIGISGGVYAGQAREQLEGAATFWELKAINPAEAIVVAASDAPVFKSYAAGNDLFAGVPAKPVEWVTIPGGKFIMGTDSGERGFEDAWPSHAVDCSVPHT